MKKILITGASGFVGSHLIEHLTNEGNWEIHGTIFGSGNDVLVEKLLDIDHCHQLNLLDAKATATLIHTIQPQYVVHLAALSSAGASFSKPAETIQNNAVAQIHLLEALRKLSVLPKTLVIGSAEEYGVVDAHEQNVAEDRAMKPISPYAVSKITQDFLGYQYHLTYALPIIRLRPFNHVGERQPPLFVLPSFAKQVVEVELGLKQHLTVIGDLQVIRDFTDVKDMVRAYVLALDACEPGEVYNVGSGNPVVIQDLLQMLTKQAKTEIPIIKDPSQFRPADVKRLVCDASKFRRQTGWQPTITLEQTVARVLEYWRGELAAIT